MPSREYSQILGKHITDLWSCQGSSYKFRWSRSSIEIYDGFYTSCYGDMFTNLYEALYKTTWKIIREGIFKYHYRGQFIGQYSPVRVEGRFGVVPKMERFKGSNGRQWMTCGRKQSDTHIRVEWLDRTRESVDIHKIEVLYYGPISICEIGYGHYVYIDRHLCDRCFNEISIQPDLTNITIDIDGKFICGICYDYFQEYYNWIPIERQLEAPFDLYDEYFKISRKHNIHFSELKKWRHSFESNGDGSEVSRSYRNILA